MPTTDIALFLGITFGVFLVFARIAHLCLKSDDVFLDIPTLIATTLIFLVLLLSLWHTAIKNAMLGAS